ncbi:MAG: S24/S26 family peptidase [Bacteroidales bacterium]|nr:S24/S26 family peptidase [Bacteroidales bacterium]
MKQVSDDQIIGDAIRLVQEGMAVTMLVKGRSMLPFILGGQESAVLTLPGEIKTGDVVLARIDGRRYVLHRVMEVSADRVVLMGDGNIRGQEVCRPEDVLARADEVVGADGKHRRLDTPRQKRRARIWRRLLPVRRWLLAIYKRTIIRGIPIQ